MYVMSYIYHECEGDGNLVSDSSPGVCLCNYVIVLHSGSSNGGIHEVYCFLNFFIPGHNNINILNIYQLDKL